jgi:hypothetical protein
VAIVHASAINIMKTITLFSLLLLSCLSIVDLQGEIISADRRITWQGNVGISGGIPDRTTVYQTISAGASLATVQSALNSCPVNQVVKLSAGNYSWNGTLDWQSVNSGVVLRGAGTGQTNITFTGGTPCIYMRATVSESNLCNSANLSANATKDARTLTLASVPSWVQVGDLIGIDQTDDPSFVSALGVEGGTPYRTRICGGASRGLDQLVRVTAKTSTTITTELPLYYGWKTSQVAQIFEPFYVPNTQGPRIGCGIEDLTIIGGFASGDSKAIHMETCDSCWVNNIEISNMPGGGGIFLTASYRCEIRHNYIHGSHLVGPGQAYGIPLYDFSCANLIEDNILSGMHVGMNGNYGASGNVFAYNYELDGISDSNENPGMNTHGVHTYMNLFEGNYCEDKMLADWTHGSSSHNTMFRNRVTGENVNSNNDSRCTTSIEYYNRYWNIVGNILGKNGPGGQNKYIEDSVNSGDGSLGTILKIGGEINVNNDFSPSDANSYTTGSFILIHGNYDTVQDTITYDSNVSDHTLLKSYYLASKPTFFGALKFPPYDPAHPASSGVTRIPAGYRYVHGVDP